MCFWQLVHLAVKVHEWIKFYVDDANQLKIKSLNWL